MHTIPDGLTQAALKNLLKIQTYVENIQPIEVVTYTWNTTSTYFLLVTFS